MRKLFWILLFVFIILKILDIASTYCGVCLRGGVELNPHFTKLAYRIGFIPAGILAISLSGGIFFGVLWLIDKTMKYRWQVLTVGAVAVIGFIGLTALAVGFNFNSLTFQHYPEGTEKLIPLLAEAPQEKIEETVNSFDRVGFCRLI